MTPEEFINFKQDDIKLNRIEEVAVFGQNDAEECFTQICKYIERLKAVRNSERLTERIVNELIDDCENRTWGETSRPDRSKFIIRWLIVATEVHPTYYKANFLFSEYQNRTAVKRRTGQEIKHISDIELWELLKEEDNNAKTNSTSKATTIEVDHSELLRSLSIYISGINVEEFNFFMKHHSLMPGTPRARWEGKKVDAYRFATFIKISLPDFNKCFVLTDGKTLKHGEKDRLGKGSLISELLTTHFKK